MKIQRHVQQGFTLIELMIVVAIIGILAAIAVPQYQQYTRKAKFTEVIGATKALKTAVELCIQDNNGSAATCNTAGANAATYGIVALVAAGRVASGTITGNGVITATAVATGGLNGETYILTPTIAAGAPVTWATTGSTCLTSPAIC